jgi:hypothetical protein
MRHLRLAESCEQSAARLLAAAANLCADAAVVVVGRVAVALLGARTTCDNACLDRGSDDAEVRLGLAGHDAAGRVAHVGAVEVEPNAPHQLGHVRLAEAGVGAGGAGRGTVVALVDAAQQHVGVKAGRPRMALDDLSNRHVLSVRRWRLGHVGRGSYSSVSTTRSMPQVRHTRRSVRTFVAGLYRDVASCRCSHMNHAASSVGSSSRVQPLPAAMRASRSA